LLSTNFDLIEEKSGEKTLKNILKKTLKITESGKIRGRLKPLKCSYVLHELLRIQEQQQER